jgi:2,4-dienoyl-CoA reductase-like NADH-dependent reductase (Old Yellow Enzyme family)
MSSILFSPLHIKKYYAKKQNRHFAMCQYSATDGFANDYLVHLGSRASGGAGLIIQEATSVSQRSNFSRRFRALER